MARVPRRFLVEENSTNHCSWRSHGHALVLDSDDAKALLLELLGKYKAKFGIEIQSYCLMGTHPHVMCRATMGQDAFSDFWKLVNWGFARWYNRRTSGRGQVVMERMSSPRIQDGRRQLEVMRYVDLNPVRARLARTAASWRWSSYRHYAFGERDDLITDAPEYLALGATAPARRKAYVGLFAVPLQTELLHRRVDLVRGPFIGDPDWIEVHRAALGPSPPS